MILNLANPRLNEGVFRLGYIAASPCQPWHPPD
jgi:hypothetical protein